MISVRARASVPVLGLGQIVAFGSSYYLLGVLADPVAEGVGVTAGAVFWALSAAFLVSGLLSPTAGRWTDAHGGRRMLMGSNLVFAAALLLLGLADGALMMFAGVMLLGVGMAGGLYGTAFAVLVEQRGDAARQGITAVSLIGALGGGLGWPLTLLMEALFGWRGVCLAWAGAHMVLCLPLYALLLPRRDVQAKGAADTRKKAESGSGDRAIRWSRPMAQLAVLFAGAWLVSTAMGAHLPRLLSRLGLTPEQAVAAASLMAASAIAVRLLDLTVLRRLSPVLIARLGCLAHPLGVATVLLGGKVWAGAVAAGQGLGNGALSVASGVLPLHLFGRENYGARQALILTPARLVQAAAPAAYGFLLDLSPLLAMSATAAICLIMFAMTFGLVSARPSEPSIGGGDR